MHSVALQDGIANHNETYGDFRDLINIDPLRNKAGDVRCAAFNFWRWVVLGQRPPVMCLMKPCHHMLQSSGSGALSEIASLCRAALTPFMANNSLGADSYKWILYGDDDTVSFLHAWLEHATSMAAMHPAHHTVLPEMCLAVIVKDFLEARVQVLLAG